MKICFCGLNINVSWTLFQSLYTFYFNEYTFPPFHKILAISCRFSKTAHRKSSWKGLSKSGTWYSSAVRSSTIDSTKHGGRICETLLWRNKVTYSIFFDKLAFFCNRYKLPYSNFILISYHVSFDTSSEPTVDYASFLSPSPGDGERNEA